MLEYLLHAKTIRFKRLMKQTIKDIVTNCNNHTNVGISFSGGKDSSVMLYLFYLAQPLCGYNLYACTFDCGAMWDDTKQVISQFQEKYNISHTYITSEYTYQELRLAEYKTGSFVQYSDLYTMEKIVFNNARMAKQMLNLDIQCISTRSDESKRRKLFFIYMDNYRYAKNTGIVSYYPLEKWTVKDIWACIYAYNLPINNVYEKFKNVFGESIEQYRVDEYLEREALENGSLHVLRMYYPEVFQKEIVHNKYLLSYL